MRNLLAIEIMPAPFGGGPALPTAARRFSGLPRPKAALPKKYNLKAKTPCKAPLCCTL